MADTRGQPLLEVSHLVKRFPLRQRGLRRARSEVSAVDDVSLSVWPGETLGIVGESGCGKSTTARLMMRLIEPTTGRVSFKGQDITELSQRELRPIRREMQLIFQNPYSSLNPRKTVAQIVSGPMRIHGAKGDLSATVGELLERVGLSRDYQDHYPREFSGGQRQRIGIARVLGLRPSLIVCDEPVSSLDVSIQAQFLALLAGLQAELDVAYVFISHDLGVIRQICDRVAVMYLGRVVEMGDVETIFSEPRHPHTLELLAAVPGKRRRRSAERLSTRTAIATEAPAGGCVYQGRCPRRQDLCREQMPALTAREGATTVACHFPVERGSEG
ncbi:MAG TPA: oligopeptide/dipeptide ABC transporter ATP-binding protein [Solirubrobacteraceae bacterium]